VQHQKLRFLDTVDTANAFKRIKASVSKPKQWPHLTRLSTWFVINLPRRQTDIWCRSPSCYVPTGRCMSVFEDPCKAFRTAGADKLMLLVIISALHGQTCNASK
jgi:hypothetical protein